MGLETLAIAAVTLVGAGVSAYGQYQSGRTQQAIAGFNARQQERNAQMQAQSLRSQAEIQRIQAEQNYRLRTSEAGARFANAKAIEANQLTQDAIDRQNSMKRREEFRRMQGSQRASIAASGVSEASGTPLDILAETAAKIQIDQEEQQYSNELRRRTLFSEAALERLGGRFALVGASMDRNSALAEAGLRDAASRSSYAGAKSEAAIARLTGSAAARAGVYQAGATLLSGVTQVYRTS